MSARIIAKAFLWTMTAAISIAVLFETVGVAVSVSAPLIRGGPIGALAIIVFSFLGVLVPRLVVPGLKQGQLIPILGDTAQEPVR